MAKAAAGNSIHQINFFKLQLYALQSIQKNTFFVFRNHPNIV